MNTENALVTKVHQVLDGVEKFKDDHESRIELLEALANRPRAAVKATPYAEVAQNIFDAPEIKALAQKRSNQAGIAIPIESLLSTKADVLTDTIGVTAREQQVFGIPQRRRPWIYDSVTRMTTTGTTVEFCRESSSSSATAGIQFGGSPQKYDGTAKTEASLAFELVDARVMTINIYTKVSRQALEDVEQIRDFLQNRLTYAVRSKLDAEVIGAGTGTGAFKGITASGNYTAYSENSPQYGTLDACRDAMGQLELVDVDPTLIVMNPGDLADIDISKASTSGDYLSGSPRAMVARNLWGIPVTTSSAVSAGDFVVGDFASAAALWTRSDAQMLIGLDGNDMTTNMLTVLVELRAGFGVVRPKAFMARL